MSKTIEKSVAETLLQKNKAVEIGGVAYEVAPPSAATLILVSELLAETPSLDAKTDDEVLRWTLKNARNCKFLGQIIATIVLGARRIDEKKVVEKKVFFGLIKYKTKTTLKDYISKESLFDPIDKTVELATELLSGLNVGGFFFTITFLNEVNLTKQTKTEATVSGL